MTRCSILECKNNSGTTNLLRSGVSYHRFPKDPHIKEKWINATGRINWMPTKSSCICSEHFAENEIFITKKGYRYIDHHVVPTKKIMSYQLQDDEMTPTCSKNITLEEPDPNSEPPTKKACIKMDQLHKDSITIIMPADNTTMKSHNMTRNTITKKDLKIKRLQAQNRRLKRKLESMEQLLKTLEEKFDISNENLTCLNYTNVEIENDMENYIKYKLVGGKLQLKKGTVPHKFKCQQKSYDEPEGSAVKKRKKILSTDEEPVPSTSCALEEPEEVFVAGFPGDTGIEDPLSFGNNDQYLETSKKRMIENTVTHESNTSDIDKSECEEHFFKNYMQKAALLCISREPQLLLGLPKECYIFINILSETTKCIPRNVMITLKKIRLHQPNAILGLDFGLATSSVTKIFRDTVPGLASALNSLVFFPPSADIQLNLPLPFRKNYTQVQSIIDCFEIQIEKPVDAVKQALTWSEYRGCYTIKYLISITPDGLINFISPGYGGKASDSLIFEDCGILQALPKGAAVLADRGFKNIDHLLQQNGNTLIRPPSVSARVKPTKKEVLDTKKIAALRIHVERTIGRLRGFGFMSPHACVDLKQVDLLDSVVISACGIVNLQKQAL